MKLEKVDCSRGAPMGRRPVTSEPDCAGPFNLVQLPLDSGGYDSGGAYWGHGEQLWYALAEGQEEVQRVFCRALSRDKAKLEVLKCFPKARFFK